VDTVVIGEAVEEAISTEEEEGDSTIAEGGEVAGLMTEVGMTEVGTIAEEMTSAGTTVGGMIAIEGTIAGGTIVEEGTTSAGTTEGEMIAIEGMIEGLLLLRMALLLPGREAEGMAMTRMVGGRK
jgi:hypothetical protein